MRKRTTKRIVLFGSLLSIILSFALGITVTVVFMRDAFPAITHPVAEFPPNAPYTFTPEHSEFAMSIAAVVPDASSSGPEAAAVVTDAKGERIQLRTTDRWSSIMGRHYRYFANFGPADGEMEVLVEADPAERFAVFYLPDSVMNAGVDRSMPGWLSAAGLFFIGTVGLLAGLMIQGDATSLEP